MKNHDIITLVTAGALALTAHDLDASQAYKVFKFRKALNKSWNELRQAERELLLDVGIDDAHAFDKRLADLRLDPEAQKEELRTAQEKLERLMRMRQDLYGEDVMLEGVMPLPYESWHLLQNENRSVKIGDKEIDILAGQVEGILENILWIAPEE